MMVHHPEIARRAQAELDAVTEETNSLPAFTDKDRLPYIDCIVKELYRHVAFFCQLYIYTDILAFLKV